MADLSKLTDADLEAIASGNLSGVSDAGLSMLASDGPAAPPRRPDAGATAAFAGAFNRTLGFPMDTLANAADLATATVGAAGHELFGMDPPNLTNRQNIPMTSAWLASKFPSVFMPAGSEEHPYAQAAGAGAGGVMLGGKSGAAPTYTGNIGRQALAAGSNVIGQGVTTATGIPEAGMLASMGVPLGVGTAQNAWQNRAQVLPFIDTAGKQANLALKPHTQAEIDAAIKLQRDALAAGSPITSAQALAQVAGSAPRITALENKVYGSQYAPQAMLQEAQQQPGRVADATRRTAQSMGRPNTSLERANQVEAAADKVMEMPRKTAGAAVQPVYDMLSKSRPQLPESVRWNLADRLNKLNEQVGLIENSSAGAAVSGVSGTVTQPSMILSTKGQPFRRAEGGVYELDNYLKELRTRIDRVSSVNPDAKQLVERAGLAPAHSEIRQALINESPALAAAKNDYQTIKAYLDNAVRSTGIPDMSRRFNADPTASKTAANWGTLEKLITKNQSADDLRVAAQYLGVEDAQAFADVTKNLLGSTLAKSANPAAFVENVRKIPNVQTAIEIGFRSQGVPKPDAAARGFMRMLDVIEAGTKPRGKLGSEVGQVESGSAGKTGVTVAVGNALARNAAILGRMREFLTKTEIETLVSNMNSPRSLENLVNLGNSQVGSPKFMRTMGNLLQPSESMGLLAAQSIAPMPNLLQLQGQ